MKPLIEFDAVSYRYPGGGEALSQISLRLDEGELAFITGPSGAGKSTLLKLVAGINRASRGQVRVDGVDVARLRSTQLAQHRQHLGLIYQNFNLLNDRSVYHNVAMPLVIRGFARSDIDRRVRAALDTVGLLTRERDTPLRLSGGEQQRVGIARAIVTKPRLLLADEPTGNLDPLMAADIMRLFRRFNEVGVAMLIATHAIDLILPLGRRIIHIENGSLSEQAPIAASQLNVNDEHGSISSQ